MDDFYIDTSASKIKNFKMPKRLKKKKYKIDKKKVFKYALVTSLFAIYAFTGEPFTSIGSYDIPVVSPAANTLYITREDIIRNNEDLDKYNVNVDYDELMSDPSQDYQSSDENYEVKDINALRSDYGNDQIQAVISGGCLDNEYVVCQNPNDGEANGYDYYYLRHDAHGNYNTSGSFFLSKTSNVGENNISKIYAHNFHHGTSFLSSAGNYNDPNYYQDHSSFNLYMDGATYELDVVGYSSEDPSKIDENIDETNLFNKINSVESNSSFQSNYEVSPDDKYVCLITCTPEGGKNTPDREVIWCKVKTLVKVNTNAKTL